MNKKTINSIFGLNIVLFFITILIIGFIIKTQTQNNEIYNINLMVSNGMNKEDIGTILGKPKRIYNKKHYDELLKIGAYHKGLTLKMPIINEVYRYDYKYRVSWQANYVLYIFFDENDTVYMKFWGNSDLFPFWY